jgi:streptogramin lyase
MRPADHHVIMVAPRLRRYLRADTILTARRRRAVFTCLISLAVASVATVAQATSTTRSSTRRASQPRSFQFYYTTVQPFRADDGRTVANVWRGRYGLVQGRTRLDPPQPVGYVPNATGIVSLPDGRLMVGAFGRRLIILDPVTGRVGSIWAPHKAARVVVDPTGRSLWAIDESGSLMRIPIAPRRHAKTYLLRGPDKQLTDLAFDRSGNAFYTAAGGSFGKVNLRRFVTQRLYQGLPSANQVIFDRYSGDLILTGDNRMTQVDPRTARIVSNVDLTSAIARTAADHARDRALCDQASTNERGTLMVACHHALVILRLHPERQSRAAATSSAVLWLRDSVGDIAPLTGTADKARTRHRCRRHCTPPPVFTG